nr:PREDICTED: actin-related protein 2/3 complex subunit 5 [Bemisia tabaci]
MAKNTSSSAFRKIDVDQFNEDAFKEDEQDFRSPPAGPDENEVMSFLNSGKYTEALQTVLRNAPLGSRNQQVKDSALNLTLKVLLSIKSSNMEDIISTLDTDMVDILMKYIYRGFEIPSERSSGHLLLWHDKVYAVGGVGSIMRVLTDRQKA